MAPKSPEDASTLLQRARLELGWKQSRVIALLIAEANKRGMQVASPASLKTMLSRWENGGGRPDAAYQRLFCTIYQRDEDELGFTDPTPDAAVLPQVAPALDEETVDYFRAVLNQHIRADNLMGPHHLVDVVRAQAALLDDILPNAKKDVREDLLVLACRYNEFAGWLYQDAGDPTNAMAFSDRAMDYAVALGDPIAVAYLLMRKSNIASDLGSHERALGLATAALRDAPKIPPRVRALAYGQQARAYALRGDENQCARSLEAAMREVTRPGADADDIAPYCTPSYIAMHAATCWTDLNAPSRAIPVFKKALAAWPVFMRRDKGLCLVRLATAHAARGDKASACEVGRQAIKTVRSATSARALLELRRLRERLALWRRDEEVSELSNAIKGLARAA